MELCEKKGDNGSYHGDMKTKAILFDDSLKLDDLKMQIINRFKIDVEAFNLILCHLHPYHRLRSPYTIKDDDDLKSFVTINDSPEVSWSLPLYVSSSNSMEVNQHQKKMTAAINNSSIAFERMMTVVENDNRTVVLYDDTIQEHDDTIPQHDDSTNDSHDDVFVRYNQHGQSSAIDFLHVRKLFNSKDEVKTAMQNVALCENFGYRLSKSTKYLYKLKCVDESCNWNFRATNVKDTEFFQIRIYNDIHTCSFDARCANHCQPTYRAIGEQIKTRYASGVKNGPDPKSIQNDMRNDYSQNISYWKAWKAKEWAQNLIRGTPESNYRLLPSYLYILEQVNSGTYTRFEIKTEDSFKYVFVSIGACVRGFNYMRKVIMVDGTHLHGKYKGNLMIATTQDANNQIYPLAFAVVDSENDNSWTWFFE